LSEYKAVVDIGTNSFHLLVAKIPESGRLQQIYREKVVMRLGTEEEGALKKISSNEMEKSLEVLKKFKDMAGYYDAELCAVATSAVRESENKDEFTKAVYDQLGLKIQVIDGSQEASYIYKGVRNALPVNDKKVLCIDIGGGSTEIIIGQNGTTGFIQSYKLGAVRLSKMFFRDYIITEEAVKECSEYIEDILDKSDLKDFVSGYDVAVGASGTIQAVAGVVAAAKYDKVPKDINGFSFTVDELKAAAELIMKYPTLEERSMIKGIERGREDILPAGALILIKLFRILEIQELTISVFALREGFLLDQFKK
jgi:exopolyphosphatase / guanosine-5'-triphosphate,3'-diphosphate pyrophosphatase